MINCVDLLNKIIEAIPVHFKCENAGNYIKLKTPFVYPDGDYINVYVLYSANESIILTDFGETFRYLDIFDLDIKLTKPRRRIVDDILLNHKLKMRDGELYVKLSHYEDFYFGLIRLLQGISRISDLLFTIKEQSISIFNEKVISYFEKHEIRYVERFSIYGNSGKEYGIDFCISQGKTLKLLKTLSVETTTGVDAAVNRIYTTWSDISKKRSDFMQITLIDDGKDIWKQEQLRLISDVSKLIVWSKIDNYVEMIKTA